MTYKDLIARVAEVIMREDTDQSADYFDLARAAVDEMMRTRKFVQVFFVPQRSGIAHALADDGTTWRWSDVEDSWLEWLPPAPQKPPALTEGKEP